MVVAYREYRKVPDTAPEQQFFITAGSETLTGSLGSAAPPERSERTARTQGRADTPTSYAGAYLPASRTTSDTADLTGLTRQLAYVRAQRDDLHHELQATQQRQQLRAADAMGDTLAIFLLSHVVERGRLRLDELAADLVAPSGWLAFSRLWRADLIDCIGAEILPTDAGLKLFEAVEQFLQRHGLTATQQP